MKQIKNEDKNRIERQEDSHNESGCCATHSKEVASEHKLNQKQEVQTGKNKQSKIMVILAAAAFVLLLFNQIQLLGIKSETSGKPIATGIGLVSASVSPTGVPDIYGKELGVKYDDISPNDPQKADLTIGKLQKYDESITLKGNDLDRYIKIASEISCEYCCGVQSIIVRKEDVEKLNSQIEAAIAAGKITKEQAAQYRQNAGDAACGCAHSFAMRGLAKYLITNHGSEFSDEQILEEMAKWKTLFFPTQMATKAQALKEKGVEFTYANLGSNRYRGAEKGASSSGSSEMVGGC